MLQSETRYLVTLCDSGFLAHLISLHESILRCCPSFSLRVICVDRAARDVLLEMGLESVEPIYVGDLADEALMNLEAERTLAEFCWTLTPSSLIWTLRDWPWATTVTYIDTDLYFLREPREIDSEFQKSGAAILLTSHGYAPEYDSTASSGRLVVQYVSAKREASDSILAKWDKECREICTLQPEIGLLGDQGYIQDWPDRYGSLIHVLAQQSLIQGPWNAQRYPYSEAEVFHFHALRLRSKNRVSLGANVIPGPTYRNVYRPYLSSMRKAIDQLHATNVEVRVFPATYSFPQRVMIAGSRIVRNIQALWVERTVRF